MTITTSCATGLFQAVIRRRAEARARHWLDAALADTSAGTPRALLEHFTLAARRLGKMAIELDGDEQTAMRAAGIDWPVASAFDELGRVALIVHAAARWEAEGLVATLEDWFRQGDNRERQAILRALALLPEPELFVALGTEACRSNVQPVFEAIACENPYPARHFPEPSFNQMVLKALFTGVALSRIVGLQDRVTPELQRMARDFASERRAAGRPVPADIGCLVEAGGSEP